MRNGSALLGQGRVEYLFEGINVESYYIEHVSNNKVLKHLNKGKTVNEAPNKGLVLW